MPLNLNQNPLTLSRSQGQQQSGFGLLGDFASDVLMSPLRIAEGVYDDTLGALIGDEDRASSFGTNKTIGGNLIQGVGEFLTLFLPATGVLKAGALGTKALRLTGAVEAAAVGRGAKAAAFGIQAARGAVASIVPDALSFGGKEDRLSNLIESNPVLSNPVTRYLQADDDDSEAEGRFKNVLEGLALGALTEPLFAAIKGMKLGKAGKAVGNFDEAVALQERELNRAIVDSETPDLFGAKAELDEARAGVKEAEPTKPRPETPNVAQQVRRHFGIGEDSPLTREAQVIDRFIDRVAPQIHETIQVQFSNKTGVKSSFDLTNRILTISHAAAKEGRLGREVIHEVYHALQDFVSPGVKKELTQAFESAKAAAIKADPDLANRLELESAMKAEDYRYKNEDEWFAEVATERYLADAQKIQGAPTTRVDGFLRQARLLVQHSLDVFRGIWGEDTVQKALASIRQHKLPVQVQFRTPAIAESLGRQVGESNRELLERIREKVNENIDLSLDPRGTPAEVAKKFSESMESLFFNSARSLDSSQDAEHMLIAVSQVYKEEIVKRGGLDRVKLTEMASEANKALATLLNFSAKDEATWLRRATATAKEDADALSNLGAQLLSYRAMARHLSGEFGKRLAKLDPTTADLRSLADLGRYSRQVAQFIAYAKGQITSTARGLASLRTGDVFDIDALTVRPKFEEAAPSVKSKTRAPAADATKASAEARGDTFDFRSESQIKAEDQKLIDEYGGEEGFREAMQRLKLVLDSGSVTFEQAIKNGDESLEEILGKLNRIVEDQGRTGIGAMLMDFYYGSLLSGAPTIAVNFISGGLMAGYQPLEKIAGAVATGTLKAFKGDLRGAQSQLAVAHKGLDQLSAITKVWAESLSFAKRTLKTGKQSLEVAGTKEIPGEGKSAISTQNLSKLRWAPDALVQHGDTIGRIVSTPGDLLRATDELWKQVNYRAVLYADAMSKARFQGLEGSARDAFVASYTDQFISNGSAVTKKRLYEIHQARILKKNPKLRDPRHAERLHAETVRLVSWVIRKNPDLTRTAEQALSIAQANTFTTPLTPGGLGSRIQGIVNQYPIFKLFLPFVRTPLNVFVAGVDRFALSRKNVARAAAVLNEALNLKIDGRMFDATALRETDARIKGVQLNLSNADPDVVAQEMGKLGMAMTTLVGVSTLSMSGMITGGGPKDPGRRKAWLEAGNQPYSLRVGDTYISYARFDPFATMFGLVADVGDYLKYAGDDPDASTASEFVKGIVASLAHQMTEKTFLQGIAGLVEALQDPHRGVDKLAEQFGAALVPNILKSARDIVTPLWQGDTSLKEMRGVLDGMMNKIPGLSETLPPRRNLLGEPLQAYENRIEQFAKGFLPIDFSTVTDDTIFKELELIGHGFTPPSYKRNGIDLHAIEHRGTTAYDRWGELWGQVRINGRTLRQELTRTIRSQDYQRLTVESTFQLDTPRRDVIRSILQTYQRAAYRKLLSENAELRKAEQQFANTVRLAKLGVSLQ